MLVAVWVRPIMHVQKHYFFSCPPARFRSDSGSRCPRRIRLPRFLRSRFSSSSNSTDFLQICLSIRFVPWLPKSIDQSRNCLVNFLFKKKGRLGSWYWKKTGRRRRRRRRGCKRKGFSPTTAVISEVQQIREIRNLHAQSCLVDMEMQAL